MKIPSWHRNLGLDGAATPEFTHTPGQVAFSPDGSKVLVTTKAGGQSIDVFDVGWFGDLSATPVVNDLPGAVPFAITFDRRGHVVAAEAGPSAVATFTLTRHGRLTPITSAETGQAATCWIVGTGSHFYASNAGSGTLTGYRNRGDGNLDPTRHHKHRCRTVDAAASAADGRFIYVQAGGPGAITSSESTTTARSAHSARCSSPEASAPKESPRPDQKARAVRVPGARGGSALGLKSRACRPSAVIGGMPSPVGVAVTSGCSADVVGRSSTAIRLTRTAHNDM